MAWLPGSICPQSPAEAETNQQTIGSFIHLDAHLTRTDSQPDPDGDKYRFTREREEAAIALTEADVVQCEGFTHFWNGAFADLEAAVRASTISRPAAAFMAATLWPNKPDQVSIDYMCRLRSKSEQVNPGRVLVNVATPTDLLRLTGQRIVRPVCNRRGPTAAGY